MLGVPRAPFAWMQKTLTYGLNFGESSRQSLEQIVTPERYATVPRRRLDILERQCNLCEGSSHLTYGQWSAHDLIVPDDASGVSESPRNPRSKNLQG